MTPTFQPGKLSGTMALTLKLLAGSALLASFLACSSQAPSGATSSEPKPSPGGKLAASPKSGSQASLKFVVYGDTRDDHAMHRKLVAMILKENPKIVIQTGDLVRSGSDNGLWKIYDDITGEMRKQTLVYPARGNHDVGGTGYEERMTSPFTSGNKLYYSFDNGGCHFVCMAIDEVTKYDPESEQYKWVVKDLEAAQAAKAKHIFVYFHVPPYSIGAHGSDLDVRKTMCPVFEKYGVQAVFNGHDHIYYHTTRNGVAYVVSGGGGAGLYPCFKDKGVIAGDVYESVHHIVVVNVNGDEVKVSAIRDDGSHVDDFTLTPAK